MAGAAQLDDAMGSLSLGAPFGAVQDEEEPPGPPPPATGAAGKPPPPSLSRLPYKDCRIPQHESDIRDYGQYELEICKQILDPKTSQALQDAAFHNKGFVSVQLLRSLLTDKALEAATGGGAVGLWMELLGSPDNVKEVFRNPMYDAKEHLSLLAKVIEGREGHKKYDPSKKDDPHNKLVAKLKQFREQCRLSRMAALRRTIKSKKGTAVQSAQRAAVLGRSAARSQAVAIASSHGRVAPVITNVAVPSMRPGTGRGGGGRSGVGGVGGGGMGGGAARGGATFYQGRGRPRNTDYTASGNIRYKHS